MKWVTTDYKGDKVEWYSADVINRIREWATGGALGYNYGDLSHYDACETILNFLNEVDE